MRDVAVVGAGYWGQNLVRNMSQLERLAAICDASPAVRDRMQRLYPHVPAHATVAEALGDDAVRAVMVAVPAIEHHAVARAAIDAGRHVYVEKPIALNVADARDLVEAAAARDLRLMVGHLLLYHPCVRWAKDAIDRGDLGEVRYLHSVRVNLGKVRSDENAMWSLAPHDISVALYLLDAMPVEVSAHGFCYLQRDKRIEDLVFLTLRFADGRAAQVHVSWLDPHKIRSLTVVGSAKMLTFDDMAATEKIRVYDKGVDTRPREVPDAPSYDSYGDLLTLRQGDILIPHVPMREPLRALCDHFLACVDRGERPLTDGESGLAVLQVLEAAQRSLDGGGAPVQVTP